MYAAFSRVPAIASLRCFYFYYRRITDARARMPSRWIDGIVIETSVIAKRTANWRRLIACLLRASSASRSHAHTHRCTQRTLHARLSVKQDDGCFTCNARISSADVTFRLITSDIQIRGNYVRWWIGKKPALRSKLREEREEGGLTRCWEEIINTTNKAGESERTNRRSCVSWLCDRTLDILFRNFYPD